MEDTEFLKQLNAILDEMEEPKAKLRELVISYAETHDKLDLVDLDGGNTDRRLDGLGFINGWVIDRLMHKTDKSRESLTRKIRKAQGYNS